MSTRVHVNQNRLRANLKPGTTHQPVIAIRNGRNDVVYADAVEIRGPSRVEDHSQNPLPCGARVSIAVADDIRVEPVGNITVEPTPLPRDPIDREVAEARQYVAKISDLRNAEIDSGMVRSVLLGRWLGQVDDVVIVEVLEDVLLARRGAAGELIKLLRDAIDNHEQESERDGR